LSKYTVDDIIDVLITTFGFKRSEVYEPLDQWLIKYPNNLEWDQGEDPIGATTEIPESIAIKAVEYFLKTKGKIQTKEYITTSLNVAHQTSFYGYDRDDITSAVEDLDTLFGFGIILRDSEKVLDAIRESRDDLGNVSRLPYEYRTVLDKLDELRTSSNKIDSTGEKVNSEQAGLYRQAVAALPELPDILDQYQSLKYAQTNAIIAETGDNDPTKVFAESFMSVFSHEPLTMASNFQYRTEDLLENAFNLEFTRPNNEPQAVQPWEMRIGGSKFFVPPIDVKVSQFFKSGSLSGGAIRQPTSPKFNSGNSETAIQVTLYFPGLESIWGIITSEENPTTTFNFDDIEETSDEKIDYFISSLRGLIAQFKYAPFLPVRNQYLNQAWNISGVTLNSMSISTIENFPFCVSVTLNMMKFNHKVFMPMIEDFNQAVHWGRFRQYMGRAAKAIQDSYKMGFLTDPGSEGSDGIALEGNPKPSWQIEQAYEQPFSRPTRKTWSEDTTRIKFYYPAKASTEIFAPDDSMFRQPKEDMDVGSSDYERDKSLWDKFLGKIGVDVDQYPEVLYDTVTNYSQKITTYTNEWTFIFEFLKYSKITSEEMNIANMNKFIDTRVDKLKKDGKINTINEEVNYRKQLKDMWFSAMFEGFANTPFYRKYIENYQYKNGKFTLQEWEVPMDELVFDEKSIFIQGITVSLSNNFAKHQIQLHDEPTYQHIGGGDNRLDINMIVLGEDNLIRIRRMFERIGGLARLEHAHGVLGFLGIKNELTGLAGIKYVIPLTYEVDTVPGFPRVYNVRLSFIDFDVFQQKREKLSSEQQNELVELFGKRNPFLRVKQAWGRFNAYPDFPLYIKDKDTGETIGTMDPDFYFRAFTTIDDDLTYWGSMPPDPGDASKIKIGPNGEVLSKDEDDPNSKSADDNISPFGVDVKVENYTEKKTNSYAPFATIRHHLISVGDDQDTSAVIDITNGGDVRVGTQGSDDSEPVFGGGGEVSGRFIEDTAVPSTMTPTIEGLTPGGKHQSPYAYNSLDPAGQYELIMNDAKYRDNNGRMIKAFPTYMLWLIDEGGRFGGVKLFDNFYGLQSVLDFSVNRSEDVLGDTLVLRLSNLYSKLTSPFKGFVRKQDGTENIVLDDDNGNVIEGTGDIPDFLIQTYENMKSGMRDDYVVELDSIRLKPGVRVHLRMGYGANPNSLDTVFNGVITSVQAGDIVEVVAQSDAIELGQYINSTNKKGHSGKIDGSIGTGFYLSEPRDLMVRLLSMGSSRFKEAFAHATRGQVFSESRFGIRHFGSILYEPLNDLERQKHALRAKSIENKLQSVAGTGKISEALTPNLSDVSSQDVKEIADGQDTSYHEMLGGNFSSFIGGAGVRMPMIGLMQSMWTNFFTKRDFEIFKRNIYPGNGTGVAQYLGGDVLDAGTIVLEAAGVKGPDLYNFINGNSSNNIFQGTVGSGPNQTQDAKTIWKDTLLNLSLSGQRIDSLGSPQNDTAPDPDAAVNQTPKVNDGDIDFPSGVENLLNTGMGTGVPMAGTLIEGGLNFANAVFNNKGSMANNPILQTLGLVQPGEADDDLPGFDEVSFRAQTYMKTVWDMFRLCASLLPNYIVAVRPFEDRSTVFYGKPHWLYTSGVIPLSTGVPKGDDKIQFEGPDEDFQNLLREATNRANPIADYEEQMKFMQEVNTANPFTTKSGLDNNAQKYASANVVSTLPSEQGGAKIPHKSGKAKLGKHVTGKPVRMPKGKDELLELALNTVQQKINEYSLKLTEEDRDRGQTVETQTALADWEAKQKILRGDIPDQEEKINELLDNPSIISNDDRYSLAPLEDYHKEIEELPDQYKFSNWQTFRNNYPVLNSPEEEQWHIKMRWPYLNWQEVLGKTWENAEGIAQGFDRLEDYTGKRIAVANPVTNKVVICAILDDGPDDVTYKAELSPDTYFILGLDKSPDTECYFGFVEKSVALGPASGKYSYGYNAFDADNRIPVPAPTTVEVPGIGNFTSKTRDYTAFVQPFQGTERMIEQLFPGEAFPNRSSRFDKYKELYEKNYFATSFLYGWMQGDNQEGANYKTEGPRQSGFYGKLGTEPDAGGFADAKYVEKYISAVTNQLKSGDTNGAQGMYDIVGEYARRIYDEDYNKRRAAVVLDPDFEAYYTNYYGDKEKASKAALETAESFNVIRKKFTNNFTGIAESEAESVWDQFRRRWHIREDTEFTEIKDAATKFILNHLRVLPASTDEQLLSQLKDPLWLDGLSSDIKDAPEFSEDPLDKILYSTNMTKIVNNFKMLLWRLPFARAWLAITTSRNTGSTAYTAAGAVVGAAVSGGNVATGAIAGYAAEQTFKALGSPDDFNFGKSEVTKLWNWYLGVNEDGGAAKELFSPDGISDLIEAAALKDPNNFTGLNAPTTVATGSYADIYKHPRIVDGLVKALERYNTPGMKGKTDIEQTAEKIKNVWDQTIGALFSTISSALSGVVGMFRLSLMEMGYGMGMLGAMQQQANILNKAFNDSIYYGIGEPGSAIWLADNPFTREYGEPVIEIREPFQRFHYLNSFQDIIDNGIQEKLDNVPTVITASSDGKYPVTVYFDKGSSPEKQFEIGIETGLFWDNARGSGFFGFLHPLLHPIETMRGLTKSATGSSDEILSRRVGLYNLKEGLKDIYGGELVIIGRADIRPHDLIYLADTYERMYGIFEVEAVTQHLTSDMGFVTSITPNAMVTINDPARWTFQSWVWSMFGVQDTRNHTRHLLSVTADKSARAYNAVLGITKDNGEVDMTALAESIQDSLRGNVQFTGGNSALVKDIATHSATGYMKPGGSRFGPTGDASEQAAGMANSVFNSPFITAFSMIPIIGSGIVDMAWSGWEWVRDNLLDQHGCYIQYLTKNGQPMDAGLSFNQGVAVGTHHTLNVLPGILGLEVKTTENGHRRITANDLMAQLGWQEIEIASVQKQVSWWNNYWNAKVLELAGKGPDPITIAPPNAYLARVLEVSDTDDNRNGITDGDTIKVQKVDKDGNDIPGSPIDVRFAGINTPELEFKVDLQRNESTDKAYLARQFVEKRLITDPVSKGFKPIVAIRESVGAGTTGGKSSTDTYGRTLAIIFHETGSTDPEQTSTDRANKLLERATAWPLIPWDTFAPNGSAYTINWELVAAGFAYTDMGGVRRNDPDRGYSSGRYQGYN